MDSRELKKMNYPENVLRAMKLEDEVIENILNDREKLASLEYVINTLDERQGYAIHSYFRDKKSYAEIGDTDIMKHISSCRCIQICEKGIRILRVPKNKNIIIYGVKAYMSKKLEEQQEHMAMVINANYEYDAKKNQIISENLSKDISILELSVRSYNCLMRAGITKVWQLFLVDVEMLKLVRNCGNFSIKEIIDHTKEFCGFSIMEDSRHNKIDAGELVIRRNTCIIMKFIDQISGVFHYTNTEPVKITGNYNTIDMYYEHMFTSNNGTEYAVYSFDGLIMENKEKYVTYIDQYYEYNWNKTCDLRLRIAEFPEDIIKHLNQNNERLNMFNTAVMPKSSYNFPTSIRIPIRHIDTAEMNNGCVKVNIIGGINEF